MEMKDKTIAFLDDSITYGLCKDSGYAREISF